MPIKPENRDRYPKDWDEIRAEVLARDGNRCKHCGLENHAWVVRNAEGAVVDRGDSRDEAEVRAMELDGVSYHTQFDDEATPIRHRAVRIVLTIAHLNHVVEENGEPGDRPNLAALCQRCHNVHDGEHRRTNASRTRAKKRGQSLLPFWEE